MPIRPKKTLQQEVKEEEKIDRNEVELLKTAVFHLRQAQVNLKPITDVNHLQKLRAEYNMSVALQHIKWDMASATNYVMQALRSLRNSLGDEQALANIAEDAMNASKAGRENRLLKAESAAVASAKEHSDKIGKRIAALENVHEALELAIKPTTLNLDQLFSVLHKLAENTHGVIQLQIDAINTYINELVLLFQYLNRAAPKRKGLRRFFPF